MIQKDDFRHIFLFLRVGKTKSVIFNFLKDAKIPYPLKAGMHPL